MFKHLVNYQFIKIIIFQFPRPLLLAYIKCFQFKMFLQCCAFSKFQRLSDVQVASQRKANLSIYCQESNPPIMFLASPACGEAPVINPLDYLGLETNINVNKNSSCLIHYSTFCVSKTFKGSFHNWFLQDLVPNREEGGSRFLNIWLGQR